MSTDELKIVRVDDGKQRELVVELLPVLDNVDRTIAAARVAGDSALLDGLRMVREQFDDVLSRHGLQRIEVVDGAFDPAVHEAVLAVPVRDPKLVGQVLVQHSPGYRFGDNVLRAAKVHVGVQPARREPKSGSPLALAFAWVGARRHLAEHPDVLQLVSAATTTFSLGPADAEWLTWTFDPHALSVSSKEPEAAS